MEEEYNTFLNNLEEAISRDDLEVIVSLWYQANVTSNFKKDKAKLAHLKNIIDAALPKLAKAHGIEFEKRMDLRKLVREYDVQRMVKKLENPEEVLNYIRDTTRRVGPREGLGKPESREPTSRQVIAISLRRKRSSLT